MKTKETSISQCIVCGSHQLTSLGGRCKYPTANGCCNGEMQLYKLTREQASKWFASKSYLEQHELSDKYFESRNPSLLILNKLKKFGKEKHKLLIVRK